VRLRKQLESKGQFIVAVAAIPHRRHCIKFSETRLPKEVECPNQVWLLWSIQVKTAVNQLSGGSRKDYDFHMSLSLAVVVLSLVALINAEQNRSATANELFARAQALGPHPPPPTPSCYKSATTGSCETSGLNCSRYDHDRIEYICG
jgi:hypothetical protein